MPIKHETIKFLIPLLALLMHTPVYSAQMNDGDLGRLFTSTSERLKLDRLRHENMIQEDAGQVPPGQINQEQSANAIVVNGVLKRSSGEKIIWINGNRVEGAKGPDNVRLYRGPDSNNRVVIGVPGKRAVKLGPGQQIRLTDGKVAESYDINSSQSK